MNSKIALISCLCLSVIYGDKVASVKQFGCKVPKHYEEIGCIANYEDGNDCPTKFTCPEFSRFTLNKCYVKGKIFDVSQYIPDGLFDMCRVNCQCNINMEIECSDVECPEDDYEDDRTQSISRYIDLKQCCSTVQTRIDQIGHLSKCEIGDNRVYYEGERMYPGGDSCSMCLCTEDFNNNTTFDENPKCVKIDCGIEHDLRQIKDGCVPVYYKTPTCCPIDMKCPERSDAIAEDALNSGNGELTCTFGNLTLKHGQKLKNNHDRLNCECSIPPFITCIQN